MTKKPGMWTETEDGFLRRAVKARLTPAEAAHALDRLERSVVIRAKVIGCPFKVTANA